MSGSSSHAVDLPSNAGQNTSLNELSKPRYKTFVIAGLPVHVFGVDQIETTEVTVMFFLHGRLGKWEDGIKFIEQMLRLVKCKSKSLLIATFDQRNHGHRLNSSKANTTWADHPSNSTHAADMHSIQMGTATDVSLLIDYLQPYIFPTGEHMIVQYLCSGISLGGHATWLVLSHDKRVQAGCPIIGCPDFMTLMSSRAEAFGGLTKDMMPDSLRAVIHALDPKVENMKGKRILILSGKKDKLVPYDKGANFINNLQSVAQSVQTEIYPGVGHRCTETMIEELSRFITREMSGAHTTSNL